MQAVEYIDKNQDKKFSSCAVFLHGYGANANDLSGFHTLPVPCRWIFPNSPLELEASYNVLGSRAWFPMQMNPQDNRLHTDKKSLYYLEKHCQQLLEFVKSFNLNSDQIILGGFSQGAIMALNMALRMQPPPRALVLMSGALFPLEILEKEKQGFSQGGSFFQCHGKEDPLLLYPESKKVCDFLQALRWKGRFVSFDGGHEIPHAVLLQIQDFMSHILS